jgi:hypothetical protein
MKLGVPGLRPGLVGSVQRVHDGPQSVVRADRSRQPLRLSCHAVPTRVATSMPPSVQRAVSSGRPRRAFTTSQRWAPCSARAARRWRGAGRRPGRRAPPRRGVGRSRLVVARAGDGLIHERLGLGPVLQMRVFCRHLSLLRPIEGLDRERPGRDFRALSVPTPRVPYLRAALPRGPPHGRGEIETPPDAPTPRCESCTRARSRSGRGSDRKWLRGGCAQCSDLH